MYFTQFKGEFTFDKKVDGDTYQLLKALSNSRRMKRNLPMEFGQDGEFFVGQENDLIETIIDRSTPPGTQPSFYCHWLIQEDRQTLKWDGNGHFSTFEEWLRYLVEKIIEPRGYILNGCVVWIGDSLEDNGVLVVIKNCVFTTKKAPDYFFVKRSFPTPRFLKNR